MRGWWLYGTNIGANPGVWRIWNDTPGPREVFAPGSPFTLTVDKDGSNVKIGWEKLGALDTGRPARNAGQHATRYQVWEGQLPIAGSGAYTYTVVLDTDGTADGPARLVASIPPGSGSRYYLVNPQGDNKEGSLGSQRPAPADYCDTIGWGKNVGQCAQKWTNPTNGSELKLKDLNPNSPTYWHARGYGLFAANVLFAAIATWRLCKLPPGDRHPRVAAGMDIAGHVLFAIGALSALFWLTSAGHRFVAAPMGPLREFGAISVTNMAMHTAVGMARARASRVVTRVP